MTEFLKKHKEIISYLFFGVLTTIVSLSVYYGLTITILDPENPLLLQCANILSWVAGVTFAFFTNRKYVFNSKNTNIKKEFCVFTGARVTTLLLDMLIMFIFVTLLDGNDKIFKIVSQVFTVVGNYILSKLIVFKK